MSEVKKFLQKSVFISIMTVLTAPFGYAIKILLTNNLSVAEVGLLTSVLSLILLLSTYNDLGFTEALNFYLPKYRSQGESGFRKIKSLIVFTFALQILSSTIIGLVLFTSAAWLASVYYQHPGAYDVILGFIPYFFLINIFQVSCNFFMGFEEPKMVKIMEFLRQSVLFFGLLALSLASGFGLSIVVDIYMWSLAFVSFLIFVALWKRFHYIFGVEGWALERWECMEISKYALWVLFTANIGVILSQVDMQMVTVFMGVESAAYYGMYLSLIGIPFIISGPIIGLYVPYIARLFAEKKEAFLVTSYRAFLSYVLMFAIWVSVFFFIGADHITMTLFGSDYLPSADILRVTSIFLFLNFFLQVDFATLAGVGRIQVRAKALLSGLSINIPATLIGMHYFGLVGTALGVCISWLIIMTVAHGALPFGREVWPDRSILLRTILGSGGVLLGVLGIYSLGGFHMIDSLSRGDAFFELGGLILLFILSFVCVHFRDMRELIRLFRY